MFIQIVHSWFYQWINIDLIYSCCFNVIKQEKMTIKMMNNTLPIGAKCCIYSTIIPVTQIYFIINFLTLTLFHP